MRSNLKDDLAVEAAVEARISGVILPETGASLNSIRLERVADSLFPFQP